MRLFKIKWQKTLVAFVVIFNFSASAFSETRANPIEISLEGTWKFSKIIYQNQPIPMPNPDLFLTWTFFLNGTDRLYWDRGTAEFCERFAHYKIVDGEFFEEIFAVNPRNASDCAQDPDMQLGRKTKNKIQVLETEIRLFFSLGDEEVTYVLLPLPSILQGL
jgi:hypothetical protein